MQWLLNPQSNHFYCAVRDCLEDGGNGFKQDLEFNGRRFSTFTSFMMMSKLRYKIGLADMSRHCPTAFTMLDWTSIVETCLEQHDFPSLKVLEGHGLQSPFNPLPLEYGKEKIMKVCQMMWKLMHEQAPSLSKDQKKSPEEAHQERLMKKVIAMKTIKNSRLTK